MCEKCLYFFNLLHNYNVDYGYESSYCCTCTGIAIEINDIEDITDCTRFEENLIPSLI